MFSRHFPVLGVWEAWPLNQDWQGNESVISITFCRDCFQLQQASKKCPAANLRCLTIKEVGSNRQYQIISTHSDMQSCCKTNFYKGSCFFESIRQWSLNLDVFYQADSTGRWEGPAWILRWRMGNAVSFGRLGATVGACRGSRALRHSLWAFDQWVAWYWNGSLPFPLQSLIWWQFGVRHQPVSDRMHKLVSYICCFYSM